MDLNKVSMMSSLMQIAGDAPSTQGKPFGPAFIGRIKPGSLSVKRLDPEKSNTDATKARIELLGKDKLLGLPILAASAVTCDGGCGLAIWTLELGKLRLEDKKRLLTWVHTAPRTIWDTDPDTPIKVQLIEQTNGQVSLVCDTST